MAAQGVSGDFEMSVGRPNKQVIQVNVPGIGLIEQGYDGKVGWSMDPVSGPAVFKGRQLSEAADDAYFDATLYGPDHVKEAAIVGTETFDGRKATKLKVVTQSGTEQMDYFDVGNRAADRIGGLARNAPGHHALDERAARLPESGRPHDAPR